ncbi:MAG: hypothetical protein JWR63_2592 [Conexibacter sp.]|nr:hypothetical protein [Conexibacter sp.]
MTTSDTLDAATERQASGDGNVLMAISNEMVRLYKQQFGRGPTTVRTLWTGGDVITVILESTLTPAERNLVRLGEHERLRETRLYFQYASVREFCEPIERLTGRKVRSFISGTDSEVDGLSVETFVLWPADAENPRSRIELSAL